ncbi:glycosyltransferase, partial [uncultured Fretibacterium sp.]|uniref:glycosyltransferase n=1 Tax=uncultured Fretibacterium sp. TaxID=1678694 RepID=UPI00262F8C0C
MSATGNYAPIVLFVYNRPEHTRRTVEALRANRLAPQSRLFVFADGPKNDGARPAVDEVRRYVTSIDGFASVEVTANEGNRGLAASVIAGVTRIVGEFGRAVVLEDDMVTVSHFLDYMNEGLDIYQNDVDVATIQAIEDAGVTVAKALKELELLHRLKRLGVRVFPEAS